MKDDSHTTDYFDQGDRTNDAGIEIGDPTHPTGKYIDGLEKSNATTKGKDEKEDDLGGWLQVGHSIGEKGQAASARSWVQR